MDTASFSWPDGALYEGEFRNGVREGHGSICLATVVGTLAEMVGTAALVLVRGRMDAAEDG
jgi:hypothetical protein